ncbi:MAG: TIGR03086 family protein [Deltaproteobacteria bacterium]|nr:TIGR03086 family protein [Deltaproteobacteria bacterium]MBI3075563.1 TIGR03086 family protein [Deltaproteobacteria bacterium]
MATMPNPIELFETEVQETRRIVAAVTPDQLTTPTPCSEWDVQALLNHMNGSANYLTTFLTGSGPAGATGSTSALDAYDAATGAALKAAKAPGALEKKNQGPMGEMTGAQMMSFAFVDFFIHGWDLAKATGQNATLNPKLIEPCHNIVAPAIEFARQAKAFGPEVKVPADARPQDKLLGLTGRKP